MGGHDLGSEIKQLITTLERDNPDLSASARVKRAWNIIADQRVREHVTGVFVVPHTGASEVVIYVDNAVWAADLNMQVEILRLKLNMELTRSADACALQKAEQVESLKFIMSKDAYISKANKVKPFRQFEEEEEKYKNLEIVELDEDEIATLQQAVCSIENDNLRDIAYSAAKANLEWQKTLDKLGA